MTGIPDAQDKRKKEDSTDRRSFIKGVAAAGLVGTAGMAEAFGKSAEQQRATVEDPKAPPGLGPHAMLDARFPVTYETSVPEGVQILMRYFAALSRRDLRGMSQTLHFPFASYEGTEVVVVQTEEELMANAPASMNMTESPERYTNHDGYLKPGTYDLFDGMEVFNADPVSVNLSLVYSRYGSDGKQLLRCQGIYCVTNNDGRWGIQLMSTIFTPANLVNVIHEDTIAAAKRLRLNHDLAYQVADDQGRWIPIGQLGRTAGVRTGGGFWEQQPKALAGQAIESFRIKGVKTRLATSEVTLESLAKIPPADFVAYRDIFSRTGVGNWGFTYGTLPHTRAIHATVDKAHMYTGVTRYTVTGDVINEHAEVSIVTLKKGRWGLAGGLASNVRHDRANDSRS